MTLEHIVYAEAWETKQGGFRGGAVDKRTGDIRRGELRETLAQARVDADSIARDMIGSAPFRTGTFRNSRNNWKMNYWLAGGR